MKEINNLKDILIKCKDSRGNLIFSFIMFGVLCFMSFWLFFPTIIFTLVFGVLVILSTISMRYWGTKYYFIKHMKKQK